jgi:hypothetical protein
VQQFASSSELAAVDAKRVAETAQQIADHAKMVAATMQTIYDASAAHAHWLKAYGEADKARAWVIYLQKACEEGMVQREMARMALISAHNAAFPRRSDRVRAEPLPAVGPFPQRDTSFL